MFLNKSNRIWFSLSFSIEQQSVSVNSMEVSIPAAILSGDLVWEMEEQSDQVLVVMAVQEPVIGAVNP